MNGMCKTEMELHESRIGNDTDIYWPVGGEQAFREHAYLSLF